jgi:site-specific DNA recombinase
MHGIKVLMAKNYIDNLSEETKKGMLEKARQGIWRSCAPLGYLNVMGADGKRTITPNPALAPLIRSMFERLRDRPALLEGGRQTRAPGRHAIPKASLPVPTTRFSAIGSTAARFGF